jgi:TDG/mug DNA glycosylase family protein
MMKRPDESNFETLPDHLRPGLDLVFIGINPGLYSVRRGQYFARATSRFWPAFSRSKLSERMRRELKLDQLLPQHDSQLPRFGIGLTDVVKRPSANASELTPRDFATWIPILLTKLRRYKPRVACFHGLTAYRPFHAFVFKSAATRPVLGEQPKTIGMTRIFVVPNPSPANAHFTLADQTEWYDRLADFFLNPERSEGALPSSSICLALSLPIRVISGKVFLFRWPDDPMARSPDFLDRRAQLNHLHRGFLPVMLPAHNQMALLRPVLMQ